MPRYEIVVGQTIRILHRIQVDAETATAAREMARDPFHWRDVPEIIARRSDGYVPQAWPREVTRG